MKVIVAYWLLMFVIILLGQVLFGLSDFSAEVFMRAGLVATLFAPAWWARWYWAPEYYRKRQAKKAKDRQP